MPSLVVIGPHIKEKQRGGGGHNVPPPAYMALKDPSLNRVKAFESALGSKRVISSTFLTP